MASEIHVNVCPVCLGNKGGFSLACGHDGCKPAYFKCDFCADEGHVSDEKLNQWVIGRALRDVRLYKNESIREWSKKFGLDAVTYSKIERGHLPIPEALMNELKSYASDTCWVCGQKDGQHITRLHAGF